MSVPVLETGHMAGTVKTVIWLAPQEPANERTNRVLLDFEVLTAEVMKSTIFWDVMPCNTLKVKQRFAGTCHSHL
jgi:hypothetical protein